MAKRNTICAGIDTGKRKLDVAIDGSSEQRQIDNRTEGYKALLDWLRSRRVKRVGIEASGGYEQAVVAELRRKRFVVVVFQPAQVRAFHPAPDPRLQPFAEQLTMIDQIGEDIARLKNRIESCRVPRFQQIWQGDIARLKAQECRAQVAGRRDPQASRPRRPA